MTHLPLSRARGRKASSFPTVGYGVATVCGVLLMIAAVWGVELNESWPAWKVAFSAIAVWGLNLILVYYVIGPPFAFSRPVILSVTFAFLMTVLGSGSYWATTQLFPLYRVFIERAALFVALCTCLSLIGCISTMKLVTAKPAVVRQRYMWDWGRLKFATYLLFAVCVLGTYMTIQKIGYIPALLGDPESQRVEFPTIAGVWFRLSMLGMVVGLIAGAQVCAGGASWLVWVMGASGIACASLYGNRFFAALPIAAIVLLWDQVRRRFSVRTVFLGLVLGLPALALFFFWRQQDQSVYVLGPVGLILYGTLSEFRDLGWTLDYYSSGAHSLLHGSTLGGLVVPLVPSVLWSTVGVDKGAVFAHSNASVLAQEMGRVTAQRVGVYGELFMNFGWVGAAFGALVYGLLIGYLDRRFLDLRDSRQVRSVIVAVVVAAAVYAQVGQWNMFTSAVVSSVYPILLLALFTARREPRAA
jgi:hypothetical protein